jgi:subtilisin family serine protease
MDPALWELLRAEAGADGDRIIEAVIRLARPGIEIPDVQMVSRFGTIATCRLRARDVIAVRARRDVMSLKAARGIGPGCEPALDPLESAGPALPDICPTDVRRSPALSLTGAGAAVAAVDWGVDVDSAAFRWPASPAANDGHRPGGTRLLSFWDQRDQAVGPRLAPYGYGSVHDREEIDRALQDPRPYERLGYHPAISDPRRRGTHGTRTLDIAAGTGGAGGLAGIAPDADLIFVHLADRNTGGLANFGDSVRLLEAVDFISRTAGSQPCVINISAGRICGPKDGTTLVERAFDELLTATPGRFLVNSMGNYARWRAHSCGAIAPGDARSLTVIVDSADITLNEVEIWYDGADEFAVRIDPPGYTGGRSVCLGERTDLLIGGRVVGRVYHRKHDPNNGDNHIVAYLDPVGCAGDWTVTLEARRVRSGRFHAWIERDDSCPACQARFTSGDSNTAATLGSITTSHLPLIVGAYDGHNPARPAASFSSRGPTRDNRPKPDLVAPGVGVLAARSAPIGASHNPGLLVRGNGTSFAAPHVTGAVALCFQAAGNRLSAHQIRSLVLGSCDPVPDSDAYRLGRGYLNIPRLVADVQQALATPADAPSEKEPTMDTEDTIVLLAAAPATAYREYLYRPRGQLARWIEDQFDIVARPGQRISQTAREGDILLEVTLGSTGPGRCCTLTPHDLELLTSRPRLAPGQLILRPRGRVEMSEPLPMEPTVDTGITADTRDRDVNYLIGQDPDATAEISAANANGVHEAANNADSAEEKSNSGPQIVIAAPAGADYATAADEPDALPLASASAPAAADVPRLGAGYVGIAAVRPGETREHTQMAEQTGPGEDWRGDLAEADAEEAAWAAFTTPPAPVAEDAPRTPIPVVLVPGIMGTRLVDPATRAKVWNPTGRRFAANAERLNNMAELLPDPTPDNVPIYTPWLNDAAAAIPGFGNLIWEVGGQLALQLASPEFQRRALEVTGAPVRVWVAGYDWRQDNRHSARTLAQVVDVALQQTGASRVVIVAHSMGGLVSRWFCRFGGANKVAALVLLGSPTHGTPQAYRALKAGLERWWSDKFPWALFPLSWPGGRLRMFRRFPSSFQLLPTAAYCAHDRGWLAFGPTPSGITDASDPVALYHDSVTGFLEGPDPTVEAHLAAREQFDRALGCFMPDPTYVLFSDRLATEARYTLAARGASVTLEMGQVGYGDETVVRYSGSAQGCALGRGLRLPLGGVSHRDLPDYPPAIATIETIILRTRRPAAAAAASHEAVMQHTVRA